MATPPRLSEVRCPQCASTHWIIDSDFRGIGGEDADVAYDDRTYSCPRCYYIGPTFVIVRQSPPAFLIGPHQLYPMKDSDTAHWLSILRKEFPDHPRLWRK